MLLAAVGDHACALRLSAVVEVMRPLPLVPFASMPPFVSGLSTIRGAPVPVVDVACLLGLGASTPPRRLVLVRVEDRRVALSVDRVVGLRDVEAVDLDAMPPLLADAPADVVEAVGHLDAGLLFVLRTARLIPASVWETLSAAESAS